jgi:ABC-type dipeptide/oligopeptide/nickel transport system ATPase component
MARDMFAKLGLEDPARVLESFPFNLSGGMGQRVGIAIGLMSEPRILFADEPTSALDVIVQAQVVELLGRINEKMGTTIVLVTHNMGVVRALADHVLVLKNGEMVEFGEASQVLDAPSEAYTRELLAAAPTLKEAGGETHG